MTCAEGNVLYLDTAGNELMVGISAGGAMLFKHREASGSQRYHSALLIPVIEQGLKRVGLSIKEIDAVCVNIGPGSFTGIRTGIASTRTMGQFLPRLAGKVYAFNSFEILRGSQLLPGDRNQPGVALYIEALRDRAYHAIVGFDSQGPFYVREPALIPMQDRPLDKLPVLASQSLVQHFDPMAVAVVAIEALNLFTPEVMLTLLANYPDAFARPWREMGPLYLQEPSITLRKEKTK